MNIQQYIGNISALFNTGNSTEHSYRGDLQLLLTSLLKDVAVTNEPKRIECGAPDYILTRKDIPIGYIEAKDVGVKLGDKLHKEQFDRYKAALNNLVITDYLEFHFFKNGMLVDSVSIASIENGKIYPKHDSFERFTALIENFALQITQSIKSPTTLAKMMAAKSKLMAQVIKSALDEDDKNQDATDLQGQMAAFKSILIHDINNASFADIYAQTIAYGLFAARYHDPSLDTFSRQEAATLIPQSNPFLRKLFQYIAGYELDNRLTWLVDELVSIFLATDVASVMHNFGKSTKQHDPIIHFYETFLAEYDPKLRKSRGVWYTPEPVVSFIVRAVDDILKTHFNLPHGLADTSKTKVTIESIEAGSKGKLVKRERELHRVQILDPATGTGTFLAQTIRHIYDNQFVNMQGAWSSYVKEHLVPRLNGFELLMTSYAMAHLKLDMLLTETGYKPEGNVERLRIYLTNSLEEHHPDTGTLFASWLSAEANEANHIKRDSPVMIVMGNPPYSGVSSNNGEWITALINDYKYIDGAHFKERKHWLNDDYVKFIRYGQYLIDKNGGGVLAFINPHGFLDNSTFRGMRWNLLKSFDEIYTIDLHGNSKKKETAPDGSRDENVFDIMQGVAITIFIKTGKKVANSLGSVFHYDVYGARQSKYNFLSSQILKTIQFKKMECLAPDYYFVPKDFSNNDVYVAGFCLNVLFQNNVTGIVTMGDSFIVANTLQELKARLDDFKSNEITADELTTKFQLGKNYAEWVLRNKNQIVLDDKKYIQIAYRPFDSRWTYFDNKFLWRWRYETMRHMVSEKNISLIFSRQSTEGYWSSIQVSEDIADNRYHFSYKGIPQQAPLYLYQDASDLLTETTRIPNLDGAIVNNIAIGLQLTFTEEKTDQPNTFAPIDLLDYIYAVLHSPTYREIYKEFLKIDFPRVPYPSDADKFWQLVALGSEMRQLHLLEGTVINQLITSYPENGNNHVDKPRYDDGKVYINDMQYFDGVPKLAWEFYIGGYQPAQKWLKDRKSLTLGYGDILHYQKIIKAMVETDRLMQLIDQIKLV